MKYDVFLVKNLPTMQETLVHIPGSGRSAGEGIGYPLQYYLGFPGGSDGKESVCNAGDLVQSLSWEDPLEKGRLPTPVFWPGEFHGLHR